ncbi:MAG: hypothetical protein IAF08_06825 [Rhizobacter sp.]|nr:hypothetical protein [Chlorobiales bacterium]
MREVQIYVQTLQQWRKRVFTVETRYPPSVYTAKISVETAEELSKDDKESLELTLLRVLEEKLRSDFKLLLEDTEEKGGFLETGALEKLSKKLERYMQKAVAPYELRQWSAAID